MVTKFLLFAALLAVATVSATPVQSDFVLAIYKFLEAFKTIMPCGYPSEGVPVLAPLVTEFYAFNYGDNNRGFIGNVSNLNINGLNNYQILGVSYDATEQHLTYDIIFSEIQILGSYEVVGFVNLAGLYLNIQQKALLNAKLVDLRFVGNYCIGQSQSNSSGLQWDVNNNDIEIYLGDVKIDNWNSLSSVAANEFNNKFSSELLNYIFTEDRAYISSLYSIFVISKCNQLLANVDMTQVNDFLLEQAVKWYSADC